jgi:hypothetical protein
MGEARTLLLQARVADDPAEVRAIKARVLLLKQQVPALRQCRLLASVLRRWRKWSEGGLQPDRSGDPFWGV